MILDQVRAALPTLPKKLAVAARYAIEHPDRIALESMRLSASRCGVAGPTMLRLARALDYETYESFRAEFQEALRAGGFGAKASALRGHFSAQEAGRLPSAFAEAAIENITETMRGLDPAAIDAFAEGVSAADRVFLLGANSMYWLAGLMETTGGMAIEGMRADHSRAASPLDHVASARKGDLAIALSLAPYARATIDAAAFAKSRGAQVFAITDGAASPLAPLADLTLAVATKSPHYYPSVVAPALVIEMLLAASVAKSRSLALIEEVDRARAASGAYLD